MKCGALVETKAELRSTERQTSPHFVDGYVV